MSKGAWAHRARARAYSALSKEIEAADSQREKEFKSSIPATLKRNREVGSKG